MSKTMPYINTVQWYDADLASKRIQQHPYYTPIHNNLMLTKSSDSALVHQGGLAGSELAKKIKEPFWYVYFAAQAVHALGRLDRYQEWLDAAIQLFIEIRKEQYEACLYNCFVYLEVIKAYFHTDCISNSSGILEAISYVMKHLPMSQSVHTELLDYQCRVYMALERWNEAKTSALDYQALCEVYDYHHYQSALYIAQIAFRLGDYLQIKAQSEMVLRTPSQASYYRTFHNAALYWDAIYRHLMGETIDEDHSWRKKLIMLDGIMDINWLGYSAIIYYARFLKHQYAKCMQYFADQSDKPPFEQKQDLLRYYYLLLNAPEGEIIELDMMNMMMGIPGGRDTLKTIRDLVDYRKTNMPLVLLTALSCGLVLLISYKVICPIRVHLNPPMPKALELLRSQFKSEIEREFFEERLRWIDEKRDYIP